MATHGSPEQPQNAPQGEQPSGGSFAISGRTLMIGGGLGGVALVAVIAVVLWQVGVLGGGGGGASGGGDVLGYIPAHAGVVLIGDNDAILNGDVPEQYVEFLEDEMEDFEGFGLSAGVYGQVDIDDDDVSLVAVASDRAAVDALEIVRGDFDFDVIREELEDGLDCEDDDYRGFELWECPGSEFPAVALFEKDRYVVFAVNRQDDLEDMLTFKARDPEKLADDENSSIRLILDQTDGGWLQIAIINDDCPINRCQGFAFALGESDDSEAIPASYAVMFSSERAASSAEDDVEIDDLLEDLFAGLALELDIEEVKAEGEFVVGTGTAEFVDPDDVRSSTRDSGSTQPVRAQQTAARSAPAAAAATTAPASSASHRDRWVEVCYDKSRELNAGGCECLYQVLATELGDTADAIPDWDASWDSWFMHTGDQITDVAGGAVDQMSNGGTPNACR